MEKKDWGVYLGIGLELTGLVLAGLYIGQWFDTKYGWNGMGALAGTFLGLICWLLHFVAVMRMMERRKSADGEGSSKGNGTGAGGKA